jgi:hypothetical protein
MTEPVHRHDSRSHNLKDKETVRTGAWRPNSDGVRLRRPHPRLMPPDTVNSALDVCPLPTMAVAPLIPKNAFGSTRPPYLSKLLRPLCPGVQ